MFQQLKNIDTAFKHIKAFSIALILVCLLLSGFSLVKSFQAVEAAQIEFTSWQMAKRWKQFPLEEKDNIAVEAKDHVKTFHQYFFNLDPDDKVIQTNISKALYLADESAKAQYDNLKENGYFSNLISANISQEINVDSVSLDIDRYPYFFRCFSTQKLIRATSTSIRNLVTEGFLRNVSRSDNNPHGFLIERWNTVSNRDTTTQTK